MTEKLFRWLSFGALAFLLLVGIYKVVKPEVDLRQTVTQNVVLQAQVQQLQQQLQNQNAAFAQIYQNPETRSAVQKHFPNLFQPVQPATGNGIAPKR